MNSTDRSTVGQLCAYLLQRFPIQDAEPWDNVGLLQGEEAAGVNGIALALNATPDTVTKAAHAGCNVLVTHHPAFLGRRPRLPIRNAHSLDASLAVSTLAKAHKLGVSLIALHTNLDVSDEAIRLPAKLTGYDYIGRLIEPVQKSSSHLKMLHYHLHAALKRFAGKTTYNHDHSCLKGCYGGVFNTRGDSANKIAQVFAKSYQCHAQILSTGARNLSKYLPHQVAFCSGSLDESVGRAALRRGIDLIVCGEVQYHTALELVLAGATLIELGHDASEEPYTNLLDGIITQDLSHDEIVRIETRPLLVSVK